MLSRFHLIPESNRQTDGRRGGSTLILLTKIPLKVQIKPWSLWHGLCAVCWLLYLSSLDPCTGPKITARSGPARQPTRPGPAQPVYHEKS